MSGHDNNQPPRQSRSYHRNNRSRVQSQQAPMAQQFQHPNIQHYQPPMAPVFQQQFIQGAQQPNVQGPPQLMMTGFPQQVIPGFPQQMMPGFPQQVIPGSLQQVMPGFPQPTILEAQLMMMQGAQQLIKQGAHQLMIQGAQQLLVHGTQQLMTQGPQLPDMQGAQQYHQPPIEQYPQPPIEQYPQPPVAQYQQLPPQQYLQPMMQKSQQQPTVREYQEPVMPQTVQQQPTIQEYEQPIRAVQPAQWNSNAPVFTPSSTVVATNSAPNARKTSENSSNASEKQEETPPAENTSTARLQDVMPLEMDNQAGPSSSSSSGPKEVQNLHERYHPMNQAGPSSSSSSGPKEVQNLHERYHPMNQAGPSVPDAQKASEKSSNAAEKQEGVLSSPGVGVQKESTGGSVSNMIREKNASVIGNKGNGREVKTTMLPATNTSTARLQDVIPLEMDNQAGPSSSSSSGPKHASERKKEVQNMHERHGVDARRETSSHSQDVTTGDDASIEQLACGVSRVRFQEGSDSIPSTSSTQMENEPSVSKISSKDIDRRLNRVSIQEGGDSVPSTSSPQNARTVSVENTRKEQNRQTTVPTKVEVPTARDTQLRPPVVDAEGFQNPRANESRCHQEPLQPEELLQIQDPPQDLDVETKSAEADNSLAAKSSQKDANVRSWDTQLCAPVIDRDGFQIVRTNKSRYQQEPLQPKEPLQIQDSLRLQESQRLSTESTSSGNGGCSTATPQKNDSSVVQSQKDDKAIRRERRALKSQQTKKQKAEKLANERKAREEDDAVLSEAFAANKGYRGEVERLSTILKKYQKSQKFLRRLFENNQSSLPNTTVLPWIVKDIMLFWDQYKLGTGRRETVAEFLNERLIHWKRLESQENASRLIACYEALIENQDEIVFQDFYVLKSLIEQFPGYETYLESELIDAVFEESDDRPSVPKITLNADLSLFLPKIDSYLKRHALRRYSNDKSDEKIDPIEIPLIVGYKRAPWFTFNILYMRTYFLHRKALYESLPNWEQNGQLQLLSDTFGQLATIPSPVLAFDACFINNAGMTPDHELVYISLLKDIVENAVDTNQ